MSYLAEYQWLFNAIGWTLLHSIWQITLIGFIWLALGRLVRKNNTSAQHFSGVIAMSLILLTSILTFTAEFLKHYPSGEATVINPVEDEVINTALLQSNLPDQLDNTLQNPVVPEVETIPQKKTSTFWISERMIHSLVLLWATGVLILGIRFLIQWLGMRQLSRKGIFPFLEKDLKVFEHLQKQLGIKKKVRYLQSEKILSPLTFGHFKPVVLLPLGMINGFPPEEIEAIILHELAHIRQNDFLINLIQTWMEILFFYHPFVWLISKKLKHLREHLCDDQAIEISGNKIAYAAALVHVHKYYLNHKNQLAMKINGKESSLGKRIRRLFEQQTFTNSSGKNINVYLLGLIFLLAIGTYAFSDFRTPTVSIAADKMNVLYIGVDNPITVAASGVASENVKLESESLEFTDRGDGHYLVKATQFGEATIKVRAKNYEPQFIKFRVKRIPDPVARISSSSGGKMTAEEFLKTNTISSELDNFVYDAKCEVLSYNLTYVAKQKDPVEVINEGALFTEKTKEVLKDLKTGDIIYIDRVMCNCPGDKEPRPINSMVFRIK